MRGRTWHTLMRIIAVRNRSVVNSISGISTAAQLTYDPRPEAWNRATNTDKI